MLLTERRWSHLLRSLALFGMWMTFHIIIRLDARSEVSRFYSFMHLTLCVLYSQTWRYSRVQQKLLPFTMKLRTRWFEVNTLVSGKLCSFMPITCHPMDLTLIGSGHWHQFVLLVLNLYTPLTKTLLFNISMAPHLSVARMPRKLPRCGQDYSILNATIWGVLTKRNHARLWQACK
jgi:hypothetical protein